MDHAENTALPPLHGADHAENTALPLLRGMDHTENTALVLLHGVDHIDNTSTVAWHGPHRKHFYCIVGHMCWNVDLCKLSELQNVYTVHHLQDVDVLSTGYFRLAMQNDIKFMLCSN
jgi:hypothetical protein